MNNREFPALKEEERKIQVTDKDAHMSMVMSHPLVESIFFFFFSHLVAQVLYTTLFPHVRNNSTNFPDPVGDLCSSRFGAFLLEACRDRTRKELGRHGR